VSLNGKVKWREEYDDYTAYHFDTDLLFRVPKLAVDIFEAADGSKSIDEVVNHVIGINSLNSSNYHGKLVKYIETLCENGLIVLS